MRCVGNFFDLRHVEISGVEEPEGYPDERIFNLTLSVIFLRKFIKKWVPNSV